MRYKECETTTGYNVQIYTYYVICISIKIVNLENLVRPLIFYFNICVLCCYDREYKRVHEW